MSARDHLGRTPLYWAASRGQAVVVRLLCAASADLELAEDVCGTTPLMAASMEGHLEAVVALVKARASLDNRDNEQNTALHLAAAYGQADVARCLLAAGASVCAENAGGCTAAVTARNNNDAVMARMLAQAEQQHGQRRVVSPSARINIKPGWIAPRWCTDSSKPPSHIR